MDNMKLWDAVKQPPSTALKDIQAGRLKGKSDINPQWRYQVMTEQFGPCGVGWKYIIDKLWTEPAGKDEVFAFALVSVYTLIGEPDVWSAPIPGIGGSMLMEQETRGLHASDEGFKMAVTDALSVALKMLGVAADVYMGKWDGSKYVDRPITHTPPPKNEPAPSGDASATISDAQQKRFWAIAKNSGKTDVDIYAYYKQLGIEHTKDIPRKYYEAACAWAEQKGA